MATGILQSAIGATNSTGYWDGVPGNRNAFADIGFQQNSLLGGATFAGCTSAFVAAVNSVRAFVWIKQYVPGVASYGPYFRLQTSNSSTFATQVLDIGGYWAQRATSAFLITGHVPQSATVGTFARIFITPHPQMPLVQGQGAVQTDSMSFDVNIDAT